MRSEFVSRVDFDSFKWEVKRSQKGGAGGGSDLRGGASPSLEVCLPPVMAQQPAPPETPSEVKGVGSRPSRPAPDISRGLSLFSIVDTEERAPPVPLFLIEDETPPLNHGSSGGGGVPIAQVGVGIGTIPAQAPVVNLNNPIFQQVFKNQVAPKFSGRVQDWSSFVEDWERYLRKLSACAPLTNQIKLELWEGALDETSLKFFRMRQRELGEKISYHEEFAKMNAQFSRDKNIGARKKWEEVFLYNMGKVTSREWRDFEANFISAWHGVEGATGEEARRVLINKLPNFVVKWVTEEEERRNLASPTIKINVPMEMTEEGVSESVRVLIGNRPTKVSKSRGGEWEVILPDFADVTKMMKYNGKMFKNSTVAVRVSLVENALTVEEIFFLVDQKLTLKDRQDLMQSGSQHPSSWGKQKARAISVEGQVGGDTKKGSKEKEKRPMTPPAKVQAPEKNPEPISRSSPSTPIRTEPSNNLSQPKSPAQPTQAPNPSSAPIPDGGKGGKGEKGGWQKGGGSWGGSWWSPPYGKGWRDDSYSGWWDQGWNRNWNKGKGDKGKGKGKGDSEGKGKGKGGRGGGSN